MTHKTFLLPMIALAMTLCVTSCAGGSAPGFCGAIHVHRWSDPAIAAMNHDDLVYAAALQDLIHKECK
jgi:hypothetical protein